MKLKKIATVLLSVALAVLLTVITPIRTYAASTDQLYVKDIVLAYRNTSDEVWKESDCKAWLKKNGYQCFDRNLNSGTDEPPCYLGYKTTTDPSEAITDISVMDMNGGYSAAEYRKVLEKNALSVGEVVKTIISAIKEFQVNYKKGSPAALSAYKTLNLYYDGVKDADGSIDKSSKERDSQMKMGDYLLGLDLDKLQIKEGESGDDMRKNELVKVFMESNSTILNTIIQQLALSAQDYQNGENQETVSWLERLSMLDPEAEYSEDNELAARAILDSWNDIAEPVYYFISLSSRIENASSQEISDCLSELTYSDYVAFMLGSSYCSKLESYPYGDGTLVDLFSKYAEELSYTDILPLCSILTEGQLAIAENYGISLLMDSADNDGKIWNSVNESVSNSAEKLKLTDGISIYAGVDRSIFTDSDIALTSAALRRQASTGDSWDDNAFDFGAWQWVAIGGLSSAIVAAVAASVYVHKAMTTYPDIPAQFWDAGLRSEEYVRDFPCKAYCSHTMNLSIGIAVGVVLIALGVFVGMAFYNYYHPTYLDIPDIMVDAVEDENGSTNYVIYHSVKDSEGHSADMNVWEGKQWNAVYTTKDKNAGSPILASFIYEVGAGNNISTDKEYLPMHYFGVSDVAYNTNDHIYGDADPIYVFFKTDPNALIASASVFTGGTLALTVGLAALCGAGIGTFVTFMCLKKKIKPRTSEQ